MSWFRRTPLAQARWVVIDCETSGLDARRDRLLSVGAVRVAGGRLRLGESFHALVRQTLASDPQNILVHGIGGDAQRSGRELSGVMRELEGFAGGAVPAGFHAPFDRRILRRHGFASPPWLDLAQIAPVLFPAEKLANTLDAWLGRFGIEVSARHDALADAFATAELLLVALAAAERQRIASVEALMRLQGARRWL